MLSSDTDICVAS